MPELEQTVSPLGSGAPSSTVPAGGAAARPVINQSFSHGGDRSAVKAEGTPVISQEVPSGGSSRGGSMLSESTRKMLANLDKYGSVAAPPDAPKDEPAKTDSPPAASGADAAGANAQASPSATPVDKASPDAAAAAPTPAPTDEHKARADRYEAANRTLVAEVERLKAAPKQSEMDKRLKALDAAERMYLDDPIGAIRHLIATVHGLDDPKHADVDAEMSGLYQDLTARELGVPLDASKRAEREALRTRQIVARDRRERSAPQAPAPDASPEAQRDAQHTQLIAGRLSDKAVADQYPLTVKFAERLHGAKPEALILKVIRDGFATGEFDPNTKDHQLIEQAARKIENHYQDLAKSFDEARPRNSTAQTPNDADAKAKQDTGRSQVAPTITNASASVAPATPPAKQPDPAKPKYKSEHERRLEIARKYMRD